jgi:hypothetical protein
MCEAIGIGEAEATARAFEGIETLVRDDRLEETSSRLRGILQDFQEQRQRELARAEQAEAVILRELGVSGSGIRINMEQSEAWREKRSELLARFRPKLDELKRELSVYLRRVSSAD